MYVAIGKYQEAVATLRDGVAKLEELRSQSVAISSKKVIIATDKDGKATNWISVQVKDKKIKKALKKFRAQVDFVDGLSTKVNEARREMIRLLDLHSDSSYTSGEIVKLSYPDRQGGVLHGERTDLPVWDESKQTLNEFLLENSEELVRTSQENEQQLSGLAAILKCQPKDVFTRICALIDGNEERTQKIKEIQND